MGIICITDLFPNFPSHILPTSSATVFRIESLLEFFDIGLMHNLRLWQIEWPQASICTSIKSFPASISTNNNLLRLFYKPSRQKKEKILLFNFKMAFKLSYWYQLFFKNAFIMSLTGVCILAILTNINFLYNVQFLIRNFINMVPCWSEPSRTPSWTSTTLTPRTSANNRYLNK